MHQPLSGTQGQITEMLIAVNEGLRLRTLLNNIFVRHTGQELATIERDLERDVYKSAQEAVEYGLVDAIMKPREESKTA
jgi:ATP-dependent Clp protease protease subunit